MRPCIPILSLALCALSAPAPGTVDPHYSALLDKGVAAFRAGKSIEAADTIRLACFGMLSEPAALSECLVHLAIAQTAAGDQVGFGATWRRIVEVEQRFAPYETAAIDEAARHEFARIVTRGIEPSELARWPIFVETANGAVEDDLAALKPRKRRRELERRAAAARGEPRWAYLLAEMDADDGKQVAALNRLEAILAAHPEHSESHCLATRLAIDAGDDDAVATHHSGCKAVVRNPATAGSVLEALARLERWQEATALYSALAPNARSTLRPIALAQQMEALAAARAPKAQVEMPAPTREPEPDLQPETVADTMADTEPDTVSNTVPNAVPHIVPKTGSHTAPDSIPNSVPNTVPSTEPDEPPVDTASEVTRIRALAAAAEDIDALDRALLEATTLADAHAGDPEAQLVAGEIAYRASSWEASAHYFERAGEISRSRPLLLFYQAVALFETGRRSEAEEALRRCVSRLSRTAYVQGYIDKILPSGPELE